MIYLSAREKKIMLEGPDHDIPWPSAKNDKLVLTHTKFSTYKNCPAQYAARYIYKTTRWVTTSQQTTGRRFHTASEKYIRDGTPLPDEFKSYQKYVDLIVKQSDKLESIYQLNLPILVEQKYAVGANLTHRYYELPDAKKNWNYNTNDVWLRSIPDVMYGGVDTFAVFDYKTGNNKYFDFGQLEVAALVIKGQEIIHGVDCSKYDRVLGGLLYVAHDDIKIKRIDISEEGTKKLYRKWMGKSIEILTATEEDHFEPRPSGLCKWCTNFDCGYNCYEEPND